MSSPKRLPAPVARAWTRLQDELRSEVARGSLVVLSGHLGRLTLGLVSSAVLARGLGPEGLSVFSVLGAALAIAATVADVGLRNSAVRQIAAELARAPRRVCPTVGAYARLKLFASLLAAGALVVLAAPLARLLRLPLPSGRGLLRIAALGLLAMALSGLVVTLLRALRHFRSMVITQIANAALTLVLMGGLFLLGRLTVASALLVGAAAAAVAAGLGYLLIPAVWRRPLIDPLDAWRTAVPRLLNFSKWLWLSAMLSVLAAHLDLLLLNHWDARRVVGHYALALNLAFKADVVNQSLLTVLLPTVSALSSRRGYLAYVRTNLARSAVLTLVMALLTPLARPFILTVYGPAYAPSVPAFYLLMAVVLLDLLTGPILLLSFPMAMPRLIAISQAAAVAALLVTGALLIPRWGTYGAATARLTGTLVAALVTGTAIALRLRQGAGFTAPPAPGSG